MNIAILAAADLGNMVQKTGETFGFDTKIFLSQVVSFVIVALVLRQFAYKPILAVLEERRQRSPRPSERIQGAAPIIKPSKRSCRYT
jgi:large-conductance mechanosensitive channel